MGNSRNTGYLQNIVQYDASNNITLPANLTVTGSIVGYATTSYVTTQINNLVNGAPGALDTLNELAAALGNDASFAATLTTSLSGKQASLSGTGFVKISGTTISYDNSTYLTTASASSTYLPLGGGTMVQGAIINMVGNDPGNGYLTFKNVNNSSREFRLIAGRTNVSGAGFSIYDSTANATRFFINNAGDTEITGLLSGTSSTFSGSVTATSLTISGTSNAIATINSTYVNGGFLSLQKSGTNYGYVGCSASLLSGTTNDFAIISPSGTLELGGGNARGLIFSTSNVATFSSSVTLPNNTYLQFNNSSGTARTVLTVDASNTTVIRHAASGGYFALQNFANTVNNLLIADSGTATFSSTIQSTGQIVYSPTLGYVSTSYQSYAGAQVWYVGAGSSGVSIQPFVIGRNLNGNSADFSIASTGAATFSSNLSVNGLATSANYKLGVTGAAYISGTNSKGIFITDSASYASIVGLNSAISAYNALELRASGTDYQLYLHTNGNVGVLNNNPGYTLDVSGNCAATRFYVSSGGNATDPMIRDKTYTSTGIYFPSANAMAITNGGAQSVLFQADGITKVSHLRTNTLYSEFSINLSGAYTSGTYYKICDSSQLTSSGIYMIVAYVDTYAIGGGIYFCTFASVPFYWFAGSSNSNSIQTLPTMLGTGHHNLTPPTVRIRLDYGVNGAKQYLEFDPNGNWSNVQGTAGATVTFYVKRIGS